jgi:hypothetical protein
MSPGLPHTWNRRVGPAIRNGRPGAIAGRHLGSVGLDLVPARLAPHDGPHVRRGGVAERHGAPRTCRWREPSRETPEPLFRRTDLLTPLADIGDPNQRFVCVTGLGVVELMFFKIDCLVLIPFY